MHWRLNTCSAALLIEFAMLGMSCLFWRLNSTWCHCNDAVFWHQFFCEIKFNGCNSLSYIICSFDFLCSLVERAQKLFGIKAFFFEEIIKAYLQLRMGQPDSWRSWTLCGQQKHQTECRYGWFVKMLSMKDVIWTVSCEPSHCSSEKNEQKLPDSVVYLLVPGQLVTTRIVSYQFPTFLC